MIIFTKGIYKLIKKNIINEPMMNKQSNGSKWTSIFYSLSFSLFLLFFSFDTISAQDTSNSKSWKDKIISWKILKKPFNFLQSSNIKQPSAEMSIPVGFTDIEELIRDLQLAGKIAPNNALTIRPFYTNSDINYNKLLNLIEILIFIA